MTFKKSQVKKTLEFVAWDGEGANDKYILFRNSRGESIKDSNGLSTQQCLDFLLRTAAARDTRTRKVNVIYGGSYDINMLLCDLSRASIYALWHTGTCQWGRYYLHYIHRKSFTVSVSRDGDGKKPNDKPFTGKTTRQGNRTSKRRTHLSLTLWDVFGFFQSTFVDAITQYLPEFDKELLDNIIAHKQDRAHFTADKMTEIEEYCTQEIAALVQIMERLYAALQTTELQIARWDGAGAIAQALLRKYGVKNHMQDFSKSDDVARQVRSIAWTAYAGGRIECVRYGHHVGTIFHADINSAYPTATLHLPCLAHGTWKHVTAFTPGVFGVWHVHYRFWPKENVFYPFFYRDTQMRIFFPFYGRGWYWQPEVEAALKWMPEGVTITEGYVWERDCDHEPFGFVESIYQQRRRYKQEGNAAQKVLKLGMNSLYGKLAQQVGHKKNENPVFQQIEWAGHITSATRAKLFDVGMQHPDDVIMFATDGIFSTAHHSVDTGVALGQWETHTHDEMVVAQSGVYWYRDGDTWTDKFRGFDRESLTWEKVLECFRKSCWTLTVPSTRFLTMGGALQSQKAWMNWRTWPTTQRTLLLLAHGTKRTDKQPWWSLTDNPSHRLFETGARISEHAALEVESQPYKKHAALILAKRLDAEEQDGFI